MEIARLAVPALARWAAKGPREAQLYILIARGLALAFAALQALGIAAGLQAAGVAAADGEWPFRLEVVAVLVGATALLTWLADAVNAKGVGDGLVLLFAASLALRFPALAANLLRLRVFLPAEVLASLLVLTALSVAVLVAFSRRKSANGPLDLWSLLLALQVLAAFGGSSGGAMWASPLDLGGMIVRVLAVGALFAIAALRRAQVDHTRLDPPASLLLFAEFAVWAAWAPIAHLTPGRGVFDLSFGFSIIFCVAAALSVLPNWRGGRALAPG
jgi:hypothetical protein